MNRPFYFHSNFIKSFNNIDHFCALLEEDYAIVTKYSKASMKYSKFAYLSFSQFLDNSYEYAPVFKNSNEFNIMVNHSGDPTLNHFDAFERLKHIYIPGTLILPLAYGDQDYISEVKNYALASVGKKYQIWDTFMLPSEYADKLKKIDFAIFNSIIQQGVGNIIMLLWYGVKLFLREENAIYVDFKRWGMHVYSIQHELTEESLSQKLTDIQINENKAILQNHLSEELVDGYYRSLINLTKNSD
jgi:hypothetical protein